MGTQAGLRIVCNTNHIGIRDTAALADDAAIALGRPDGATYAALTEDMHRLDRRTTLCPDEYDDVPFWDANNDPIPYF